MKRKERVKAMIEGSEIDYLPSQLDFVPYRLNTFLEELNISIDDFDAWSDNHFYHIYPLTESCNFSSGSKEDEKLIELAVKNNIIEKHLDQRYVYDSFHVTWLKNRDGIRDVENPLKSGINKFKSPDLNSKDIFAHAIEELNKKKDEYYIVGLQHLLLFERAYLLLGYENFMLKLATEVKIIEKLLDDITEYQMEIAKRFVEIGVDAIRTGDDYGMQSGLQIDENLWRKLFKPRLAKIWRIYKDSGITIMHHSCGDIGKILPDLVEIGLQVIHPVQPLAMKIEELADNFGKKLVFHGGIDTQRLLPFGRPNEIISAVKECVKILGKNKKYIIAPSQEIMNDVSTENIKALVEGIKRYRKL